MRPRPRTLLIAALTLSAALTGCLAGEETVPLAETPTVVDDGDNRTARGQGGNGTGNGAGDGNGTLAMDAPGWGLGMWWRLQLTGGAEERAFTLAVHETTRNGYVVLSDDALLATYDAVFDLAYVGPVSARDLSGAQEGAAVKFYQWPLEHGATWTTTWDGQEVTVTANATTVTTPAGDEPGYSLTARTSDGAAYALYDYAPSVGWWTRLEFPTLGYGLTLQESGFGYGGELLRMDATAHVTVSGSGAHAAPRAFTVTDAATHVVAWSAGGGAAYGEAVELVDPDGNAHGQGPTLCALCGSFAFWLIDAVPGEWRAVAAGGGPPALSGYAFEAYEATLRTLTIAYE